MVLDSILGKVDFSSPKVRINGKVYDKFSLVEFMRRLDFKRFYWSLMYAYDTYTYVELREILYDYLVGDLD